MTKSAYLLFNSNAIKLITLIISQLNSFCSEVLWGKALQLWGDGGFFNAKRWFLISQKVKQYQKLSQIIH